MNHYFPDWNLDPEHPEANYGKALGSSQELVELLWENGQVVLNNQTHRKPVIDLIESRQGGKFNQSSNHVEGFSLINPPILAQGEDHPVSWNHCQIDDPFEKELSSFLLAELPPISNLDLAHEKRPIHQHLDSFKFCNNDGSQISHVLPYNGHSETLCGNSSHPTKFQKLNSVIPHANIAEVVSTRKHAPNNPSHYGGGSSHCGSNQVIHDADTSLASCSEVGRRMPKIAAEVEDSYGKVASESERSNDRETAVSLSGGGSGFTSIGGRWNQSNGNNSSKRKIRDEENSEPQSEAAFLEADTRKKASQKTGITRKSRAAEVHNLSERRRRDRVNEKMRALQELLPSSNQTDKASMLDDAIKYMRSLQLQLQMMWMGSQMAMFPGCQVPPYMSRSELGISPQMLPFIQSGMNLSRLPLMDQAMAVASTPNQAAICQATFLNSMSYQNQFQNSNFSDQYGNCMGFYPIQNANQQPMNMYSYGSNIPLQNQAPPSAANGPPS